VDGVDAFGKFPADSPDDSPDGEGGCPKGTPVVLMRDRLDVVFADDEVSATVILDRLLHHGDVVAVNGLSYRLKKRLQAVECETDVA
jgi:IstB-like ATP binding protein